VIAQVGRLHLYEGWDAFTVTRAVRAFAELGTRAVVLTNASGGIVPHWPPGTLMLVRDHLNLQGRSPLAREEAARANPYDVELAVPLEQAAGRLGLRLEQGVYAGVLGPSYETPAEIRMLRALGAQAVGMSTVAEASAARAAGLRVAALSCIANPAAGLSGAVLRHADVLATVAAAARDVQRLLEAAAPELARVTT
jgi:purine-nucleoside phosphorylase